MSVLVIKLGALGDVVMATALIRRLQQHHAQERLWVLTSTSYAGLFEHWQGVQVHAVPRRGLRAMLSTLAWLRRGRFRRIYDFQSSERTAVLVALSGAPERVGNRPGFPYTHAPPWHYRGQGHIFSHMQAVLAAAGAGEAEPVPFLPAGPATRERVARWRSDHGLQAGAYAVLHPGGSARWPSKRWPHFASLGRAIERSGVRVVWVGGGAERDLNAELAREVGIDATGRFSVLELAELGRHARFAVTNDSGPMHVLSAAGIPVFALFGPTDWRRHHALGQSSHVMVAEAPCAPCYLTVCPPARRHACMVDLGPDAVLGRIAAAGLLRPDPAFQEAR